MLGSSIVLAVFLLGTGSASAQSGWDSTIQGYEAGEVHLTLDSQSRILEVVVKECELCQKKSYLPTRDLKVSHGSDVLGRADYGSASGNAGTIIFDDADDMVFEVQYWLSREEGRVQ